MHGTAGTHHKSTASTPHSRASCILCTAIAVRAAALNLPAGPTTCPVHSGSVPFSTAHLLGLRGVPLRSASAVSWRDPLSYTRAPATRMAKPPAWIQL